MAAEAVGADVKDIRACRDLLDEGDLQPLAGTAREAHLQEGETKSETKPETKSETESETK